MAATPRSKPLSPGIISGIGVITRMVPEAEIARPEKKLGSPTSRLRAVPKQPHRTGRPIRVTHIDTPAIASPRTIESQAPILSLGIPDNVNPAANSQSAKTRATTSALGPSTLKTFPTSCSLPFGLASFAAPDHRKIADSAAIVMAIMGDDRGHHRARAVPPTPQPFARSLDSDLAYTVHTRMYCVLPSKPCILGTIVWWTAARACRGSGLPRFPAVSLLPIPLRVQ